MNYKEPLPTYRVDGDVVWYDHFLPKFEGKSLISLINGITRVGTIKILDLGAGDYTFAIDCHKRWPGKVSVTGVSRDNFLAPERIQTIDQLGIQINQMETVDVPEILSPDYQLAVSVLTNIYDNKVDYVDVMWRMLTNGSIGLLDNLLISFNSNVEELTRILRREGYNVEIKSIHQLLPDKISHSNPPVIQPVPEKERFVYLKALEQLQRDQPKPS